MLASDIGQTVKTVHYTLYERNTVKYETYFPKQINNFTGIVIGIRVMYIYCRLRSYMEIINVFVC